MALTRKFLSAMGIEAEKIDEIIEAHVETVNAVKSERDELKDKAEKADALEKELRETKDKLNTAGTDGFQNKYDELKKEFDAYKAEQEAKATLKAKEDAYKALLKSTGVSEKRIDSVMKVTDLKDIELDDEGNVKDADKLSEGIKTEWADFITQEHQEGANTQNPPTDGEGGKVSEIPSIF